MSKEIGKPVGKSKNIFLYKRILILVFYFKVGGEEGDRSCETDVE